MPEISSEIEPVGKRIRSLRKACGMTQEALADASGALKREEIVKIEGGENQVSSLRAAVALARAFGLSLEQMSDFISGTLTVDVAKALIDARKG